VDQGTGFDGTAGRLAGAVMARLNRDMEVAAVTELDPGPEDAVLAIGFGPGVGIAALERRLPGGLVAGIDPSATMLRQALQRNRAAIAAGRVTLVQAAAGSIPWPADSFNGVLAVNSMQLWKPLPDALHEVARVLSPTGAFVSLTHRWAVEKRAPLEQWIESASLFLAGSGLTGIAHRSVRFHSGEALVLRARCPSRATR
jgi:ubiquinone/menaquinone biosynthesis C-methylase UbiE